MKHIKLLDTRRLPSQKIFTHRDLLTCTHVFIRIDRVRKPLEPPYNGPFPVVKKHDKYFTVIIKSKDINISVDRLQPAYLLLAEKDAPHHNKFDTAPTFPNENVTKHQETEKQQSDLLDKYAQKQTTRSGRRVRFPACHKDELHTIHYCSLSYV
ncbi:hypothetical protein AVEN_64724-1 [Araneus ventricosus]|uniref:Uncharacterized protein n=1 Tax=Araneus ventricosus TaxID=182803 RepID=A0A4Y2LNX6_ARAVE|nr:hypothetical protein AVEN_64724-1 [Araneus ventricosus]